MVSSNNKGEEGFLMIDVLIGLTVAIMLSTVFVGGMMSAVRVSSSHKKALQGELLAVELVEIVRELEKSNWATLSDGHCATVCHPKPTTTTPLEWELKVNTETINGFTRSITIEDVTRVSGGIVDDGSGIPDVDTKKVTVLVTWASFGNSKNISLETYVYEYL